MNATAGPKTQHGKQLQCSARPRMPTPKATSGDAVPLALDSQEWVTLASGQKVRVDALGYRPNVACVLYNDEGKVFTCRRYV